MKKMGVEWNVGTIRLCITPNLTYQKKLKISRSCQVRLVLSLTRGGWEDIAATYYEHSSYCTADGSKLAGEGDVGPTYRVILVVSELRWVDFI